MSNLAGGIPSNLRDLPKEFDTFRQKVLDNQELILKATQKRFRKCRRLEDGGHENVCVSATDATPGKGKLWHSTEGHIGEYWKDEDGVWRGKVTLEIATPQQLDIQVWASNLIYATEEEKTED